MKIIADLLFSYFFGIGPMKFKLLIKTFGSAKQVLLANEKELCRVLGQKTALKFIIFKKNFDFEKELARINKENIHVICQKDVFYPDRLKNISDPPICLFAKGNLKNLDLKNKHAIGVVGTRKPTAYGQQVAKKLTAGLAEQGFIIVSGMAMGIDAVAHQTALDYKTKTIAVLGCGVDIIYPAINYKLYHQIIKNDGLIISEFPPGHRVLKGLFVARNRIISALADGVLVVEGAKDSGALITARYAAEQGREVFAPPAPINSYLSAAPNILLKNGAKLVTEVNDILEEFNLKKPSIKIANIKEKLNQEEIVFFDLLMVAKSSDEICEKLNLSIDKVLNMLSVLEIKGIIEKNSEGKYQLA